jgi:autotransporter-associated beta strand protein
LPSNLVVNGGSVQNTGNQVADSCDVYINSGTYGQKGGDWNSGSGATDTFRDLYMTGGTYNANATVIAAPAGIKLGQILLSGTRRFDIGDGPAPADLLIEPNISNNGALVGGLTKTGEGTLVLASTNSYTGATAISNGTLAVNGSVASPVTVSGGAALAGTGVVTVASGPALTVESGGIVDPGAAGATGTLSVTGNVSFAASTLYRVDLDGANADRLAVFGAVSGGPVSVKTVGSGTIPCLVMTASSITCSFVSAEPGLSVSKRANNTELWLVKRQGTMISVF